MWELVFSLMHVRRYGGIFLLFTLCSPIVGKLRKVVCGETCAVGDVRALAQLHLAGGVCKVG